MARILVVDDSIVMRRNLQTILTEGGHEVVGQAVNGKQAVIAYSELKPDLVTMDISMPIMSGIDAVNHIINKDSEAKIIMISALNQKQMVFDALNNGAKHYVIKPIDPGVLLNVISEVLYEDGAGAEGSNDSKAAINEAGFTVENLNGKFIIRLNAFLGIKDLAGLETAVKGMLFIKPLKLTFDFGELSVVQESVLQQILRMAENVRSSGGDVDFLTANELLLKKIQEGEAK